MEDNMNFEAPAHGRGMASSGMRILSLKVALISTGVLSLALLMKLSIPSIKNFAVYDVPVIWSVLVSWLKPPYLYFVINGIIITIAASSRFHQKPDEEQSFQLEPSVSSKSQLATDLRLDFAAASSQLEFTVVEPPVKHENSSEPLEAMPVMVNGSYVAGNEEEDEFVISKSTWTRTPKVDSPNIQSENLFSKPLVSERFAHRKPVKKASPEGGRVLRVARPKKQETFENTWKAITEGRHVPLTRHLKKSETWENHGRQSISDQYQSPPPAVRKAETFKDRTNYEPVPSGSPSPVGSGKFRREPSLSQDELNRRVEAFIKKFNDEMRLQRQESLNQYKEMIGRGTS